MDRSEDYLENKSKKVVDSFENLLKHNDEIAAETKSDFERLGIFAVNIMGSPGSGKTTLLENLIDQYPGSPVELAVLEGDLETNRDADRIRSKAIQAHQICTGSVCHLSAAMVAEALQHLDLSPVRFLFIENVGNLVCPSKFALGTHVNIVTVSIPEGDDKPVKYPVMIRMADIILLTKTDLLPHFNFNMQRCRREIAAINPRARILETATGNTDSFNNIWTELENDR